MQVGFHAKNTTDDNGNPTGGVVVGTGFTISWQDGPLGRGEDRKAPNGAFVEDVIAAVRQRLAFYQNSNDGKFWCPENEQAMDHLWDALQALESRTKAREARKVEGTHEA
ncbi:MAG: hypothetical protein H6829_09590 [Planctomycetes bacterium]|nr:hypothetical protein [Planctomycetota bacterium]MCB9912629.1 hypothetical protein [Planctomycetota bacterium]